MNFVSSPTTSSSYISPVQFYVFRPPPINGQKLIWFGIMDIVYHDDFKKKHCVLSNFRKSLINFSDNSVIDRMKITRERDLLFGKKKGPTLSLHLFCGKFWSSSECLVFRNAHPGKFFHLQEFLTDQQHEYLLLIWFKTNKIFFKTLLPTTWIKQP